MIGPSEMFKMPNNVSESLTSSFDCLSCSDFRLIFFIFVLIIDQYAVIKIFLAKRDYVTFG